jgi:hypothetical protein
MPPTFKKAPTTGRGSGSRPPVVKGPTKPTVTVIGKETPMVQPHPSLGRGAGQPRQRIVTPSGPKVTPPKPPAKTPKPRYGIPYKLAEVPGSKPPGKAEIPPLKVADMTKPPRVRKARRLRMPR